MTNFYRNFLKLCSMLVLQNVVTLSVNLADNIMLGAFSETALSGVTTVNQVQFVFQQLLMALGDGLVIFGSQYWGKKETEPVRKISAWAMRTGLFIAFVLFILASLFPTQLLGLFTTDQTIIEAGRSYLAIIRFTYFFFAVTQILLATLRCVEIAGVAFGLSVMTLVINCSINWILIYGHFGAPRMGAAGAAVGTLTARIAEICVLIIYICKKQNWIGICIRDYLHSDLRFGRKYYKVVCPLLVLQGLWGVNTALQTAILGHMTAAAIAANRCSLQSVFDGEIRCCGSRLRCISYHGKNYRFREPGTCEGLFQKAPEIICSHGTHLWYPSFLYPDPGAEPVSAFAGNERDGQYLSYHFKCGNGRDVLSDADKRWYYPGKRKHRLFHEGGSDQYLGDRDSPVPVYGICGQCIFGSSGMLPECRSDL